MNTIDMKYGKVESIKQVEYIKGQSIASLLRFKGIELSSDGKVKRIKV